MYFHSQQGNGFRGSELTVPLCVWCLVLTIPYIILTPLCTIQGGSPLWAPASVWTTSRCCLCSNPLHSLTHPACSSPPTSVFNQLVPFISGNTGKKEFDSQPRFFFPKPDFTSRPTTTPRPTCFQATIESLLKPGGGILDHRNPFQPLTSTDQAMDEKWWRADILASCWGFKQLNTLFTVLMQLAQDSG